MGAAISRAFAVEEGRLTLAGRDNDAIVPDAIVVGCDLMDPASCEAAPARVLAEWGGLDVLFDEIVTSILKGCFHTLRAVLPAMIAQNSRKIVNVGTVGVRGRARRMAYSASKWGPRGITKNFALGVGACGINVNCVAPGIVDGERFRGKLVPEMVRRLGISEDDAVERPAADYALKRITTDTDLAHACLFLASEMSRQITGVDHPVDGGWAML